MSKLNFVLIAGLTAVIGANAATIQVGGANGLTSAYITGNGGTIGASWGLKSYTAQLFQGATINPTVGQPNSLPAGGAAAIMTDAAGNVFSMINDGTAGHNLWASPGATAVTSLLVPINVANPGDVYIMLNDYAGFAGSNPTITFNFTGGAIVDAIPDKINGTGAIRSAIDCRVTTNNGPGGITCPGPQTVPAGNVVSSSAGGTVVNTLLNGDQITTSTIWSGTYNIAAGINGGASEFFYNSTTGSTGNVILDELHFVFATSHAGQTLTSILFTPNSANGSSTSRLALTAIDVAQVAVVGTPEPSTMVLFGTGFALLGLSRRRNRK